MIGSCLLSCEMIISSESYLARLGAPKRDVTWLSVVVFVVCGNNHENLFLLIKVVFVSPCLAVALRAIIKLEK